MSRGTHLLAPAVRDVVTAAVWRVEALTWLGLTASTAEEREPVRLTIEGKFVSEVSYG